MPSLDSVPLWGIFLLTAAVILGSIRLGRLLGTWQRRRGDSKSDVSGAMIGATMGLLAFMLAFTFNGAANRHDVRKALVMEETNAINTTWLRAGFLAEQERVRMRELLREYVDVRVRATAEGADISGASHASEALQRRMWQLQESAAHQQPGSISIGLLAESLNQTIDLHLKRVTVGVRNRVPSTIWLALMALTIVGMGMFGMQMGMDGSRQRGIEVSLALAFSIVLFLIADLDRPQQGLLNVSQQSMIDLQQQLQAVRQAPLP